MEFSNKKHAYLIIAHNNWKQLSLLLSVLDDERNDIFKSVPLAKLLVKGAIGSHYCGQ